MHIFLVIFLIHLILISNNSYICGYLMFWPFGVHRCSVSLFTLMTPPETISLCFAVGSWDMSACSAKNWVATERLGRRKQQNKVCSYMHRINISVMVKTVSCKQGNIIVLSETFLDIWVFWTVHCVRTLPSIPDLKCGNICGWGGDYTLEVVHVTWSAREGNFQYFIVW